MLFSGDALRTQGRGSIDGSLRENKSPESISPGRKQGRAATRGQTSYLVSKLIWVIHEWCDPPAACGLATKLRHKKLDNIDPNCYDDVSPQADDLSSTKRDRINSRNDSRNTHNFFAPQAT